jgi:hypothetical protein
MKQVFDLYSDPFFKKLLELLAPLFQRPLGTLPRDSKELAKFQKNNRSLFTPSEEYLMNVFQRATSLADIFSRLSQSVYLLSRSPKSIRMHGMKMNRNEWVEYHFFIYSTSLVSLLDCSLILIAEVYKLGLLPRHCTFDIITNHATIRGSKLSKILKKLRKELTSTTDRRHRILHRGESPDLGELTDALSFLQLRVMTVINATDDSMINKNNLSYIWRVLFKEVRPQLNIAIDSTRIIVSEILSYLLPIVIKKNSILNMKISQKS